MQDSPRNTTRPSPGSSDVRAYYATVASGYDRKANRACMRAYVGLLSEHLAGARRVLEVGTGSSGPIADIDAPFRAACDFSVPMLRASRTGASVTRFAADALALPCRDAAFDGVFCINLLEHVADPRQALGEMARVLAPGGRCAIVTPNGDVEGLLDLLERLRLKIPEGPHRFLTTRALRDVAPRSMAIVEHRRFLAFPAGPTAFVRAIDRCAGGWGLFQFAVLTKPSR